MSTWLREKSCISLRHALRPLLLFLLHPPATPPLLSLTVTKRIGSGVLSSAAAVIVLFSNLNSESLTNSVNKARPRLSPSEFSPGAEVFSCSEAPPDQSAPSIPVCFSPSSPPRPSALHPPSPPPALASLFLSLTSYLCFFLFFCRVSFPPSVPLACPSVCPSIPVCAGSLCNGVIHSSLVCLKGLS